MNTERPPTIDPLAAARWAERIPAESPWLHEEVARRMEGRLDWIMRAPSRWVHWAPLQGGMQAHALLEKRYPKSACYVVQSSAPQNARAQELLQRSWWKKALGGRPPVLFETPSAPVEMLWANMSLHQHADPLALMQGWHGHLATDGFLMFSCLGPDTLRQLRSIFSQQGWPEPCHAFTDMHDWGDMLVQAGFAEPVMDMEHITLSYSSPESLLGELRQLGRNLHVGRFAGLRGRQWHQRLLTNLQQGLCSSGDAGRLTLTFEIIYGHAFKPAPRLPVTGQSVIKLEDMREVLARPRAPKAPGR
jgi:malonyl-CoA O-methyltransferase